MTDDLDPAFAEIRNMFFEESAELLGDAAARLDALQSDPAAGDADDINALFRAVHSVKGGSGAWGLAAMGEFAHGYETVLGLIRNGDLAMDGAMVDLLLEANDALSALLQAAQSGTDPDGPSWRPLADRLAGLGAGGPADTPGVEADAPARPRVAITLPGDLDGAFAGELKDRVVVAMSETEIDLHVDAGHVERVRTPVIQVLLAAAQDVAASGGTFLLTNPSQALSKAMTSLGLRRQLAKWSG